MRNSNFPKREPGSNSWLLSFSWEQRKLGELGSVAMNKRIFKEQTSESGDVPFYKIGTFGGVADAFISRELFEEYKAKYPYPQKGDILISASGSIGRTIEFSGQDEYFQDSNIVWLDHNGHIKNSFLKYFYETVKWAGAEGSTIKRLYNSIILETPISLPSHEEQEKIGQFFKSLDRLITLHQCNYFFNATEMVSKNVEKTFSWEQRKLGQIAQETHGGGTPKTSCTHFWNGEIPWIQSSDIEDGKVENVIPRKRISQQGLNQSAARLVPGNSIAIVTRVGVGKLALMTFPYTTSQDFLSLSKLSVDAYWGVYALYHKLQQEVQSVQGTSIKGMTKEYALALTVNVPCKEQEQQKIGAFFQSLDRLITLHQRKCFFSRVRKKLKITSQKTNAWEQRKFSDLVLIERGGSPRPIDAFITSASDGLNWVKIGDAPSQGKYITKTAEKIRPEGLSKTRQVQPGDLILSNSMSFGRPYIMGIYGCIHDGWLLIRSNNSVFDLTFLCHLLGTAQMLEQYRALAAGSTVNNLNKELVGSAKVTFPTFNEQIKIGQILECIDDLITLHQRERLFLILEEILC